MKEDDKSRGLHSSNLSVRSSRNSLYNYQTFERDDALLLNAKNIHVHETDESNIPMLLKTRKIALRDFFTVLAITFHAVFEGLAVGLEPDPTNIWILFAGIDRMLSILPSIRTFIKLLELSTMY